MERQKWCVASLHTYCGTTLLICLENSRTIEELNTTPCFHLADNYCGKFFSQPWLQLIALMFCRPTRIRILDQHTYTLEKPITVLGALSIVHDWSCTNMGERTLRRTVWQDRKAFFERLASLSFDNSSKTTSKRLIAQPRTRPNNLS